MGIFRSLLALLSLFAANADNEFSDEQLAVIFPPDGQLNLAGTSEVFRDSRWPNGQVPFDIGPNFSPAEVMTIQNALAGLTMGAGINTCLQFFLVVNRAESYLSFRRNGVDPEDCSSLVGRQCPRSTVSDKCNCPGGNMCPQRNGEQFINLGANCMAIRIVQHEVLHALGFIHEHQRPDRDTFVTVQPDSSSMILANAFRPNFYRDNFGKASWDDTVVLNRYDFNSIMHYGETPFNGANACIAITGNPCNHTANPGDPQGSNDLPRIIPLDPAANINNNNVVSPLDLVGINRVYCPLLTQGRFQNEFPGRAAVVASCPNGIIFRPDVGVVEREGQVSWRSDAAQAIRPEAMSFSRISVHEVDPNQQDGIFTSGEPVAIFSTDTGRWCAFPPPGQGPVQCNRERVEGWERVRLRKARNTEGGFFGSPGDVIVDGDRFTIQRTETDDIVFINNDFCDGPLITDASPPEGRATFSMTFSGSMGASARVSLQSAAAPTATPVFLRLDGPNVPLNGIEQAGIGLTGQNLEARDERFILLYRRKPDALTDFSPFPGPVAISSAFFSNRYIQIRSRDPANPCSASNVGNCVVVIAHTYSIDDVLFKENVFNQAGRVQYESVSPPFLYLKLAVADCLTETPNSIVPGGCGDVTVTNVNTDPETLFIREDIAQSRGGFLNLDGSNPGDGEGPSLSLMCEDRVILATDSIDIQAGVGSGTTLTSLNCQVTERRDPPSAAPQSRADMFTSTTPQVSVAPPGGTWPLGRYSATCTASGMSGEQSATATCSFSFRINVRPTPALRLRDSQGNIDGFGNVVDSSGELEINWSEGVREFRRRFAPGPVCPQITGPIAISGFVPVPATASQEEEDIFIDNHVIRFACSGNGAVTVRFTDGCAVDSDNGPSLASNTLSFECIAPTNPLGLMVVEDRDAERAGLVGGPFTIQLLFTVPVTGLELSDFILVRATIDRISPTPSPGTFSSIYDILVTPQEGAVSVTLPAGAVADTDGLPNAPVAPFQVTADLNPPVGVMSIDDLDQERAGTVDGPFTVILRFNREVFGLLMSDIQVVGGTVQRIDPVVAAQTQGAERYNLRIVPDPPAQQSAPPAPVTVTIPPNSCIDQNGRSPVLITKSWLADLTSPQGKMQIEDLDQVRNGVVDGPFLVKLIFNKEVWGLSNQDFVGGNCLNCAVAVIEPPPSAQTQSAEQYSLRVTPLSDGPVTITLPSGGVEDQKGALTTEDISLTVNALLQGPLGAMTIDDTQQERNGIVDGSFTVTLRFNKAVYGLTVEDFQLVNCAVAPLDPTPSLQTQSAELYSLQLTPLTDGPVSIILPAGAVEDQKGNSNGNDIVLETAADLTPPVTTLDAPRIGVEFGGVKSSSGDMERGILRKADNPVVIRAYVNEEIDQVDPIRRTDNNIRTPDLLVKGGHVVDVNPCGEPLPSNGTVCTEFTVNVVQIDKRAPTTDLLVTIQEAMILDLAGNPNAAATPVELTFDLICPELSMVCTYDKLEANNKASQSALAKEVAKKEATKKDVTCVVLASEPVRDLPRAGIHVTRGKLEKITKFGAQRFELEIVDFSEDSINFPITVTIYEGEVQDEAGNPTLEDTIASPQTKYEQNLNDKAESSERTYDFGTNLKERLENMWGGLNMKPGGIFDLNKLDLDSLDLSQMGLNFDDFKGLSGADSGDNQDGSGDLLIKSLLTGLRP